MSQNHRETWQRGFEGANRGSRTKIVGMFLLACCSAPIFNAGLAVINRRTSGRGTKLLTQSELRVVHSTSVRSPRNVGIIAPFLEEKFRKRSFIRSRLEDRWEAARKIAYTGRRRLVIKKSTVRWFVFISLAEPRETFHGSWIVHPEITKGLVLLSFVSSFFISCSITATRLNWAIERNCETKRKNGRFRCS